MLELVLPEADSIELMETIARALEAGPADYIGKPFSATELTAPIRAAVRRRAEPEPFVLGEFAILYDERPVSVSGRPVDLTTTEYELPSFAITTIVSRPIPTSCELQPPAPPAPNGQEILPCTQTPCGTTSSPHGRCPRRRARPRRTAPTSCHRRSPGVPCLSIVIPPATCPSASIPSDVGIRADFMAPANYRLRRRTPRPTSLLRIQGSRTLLTPADDRYTPPSQPGSYNRQLRHLAPRSMKDAAARITLCLAADTATPQSLQSLTARQEELDCPQRRSWSIISRNGFGPSLSRHVYA